MITPQSYVPVSWNRRPVSLLNKEQNLPNISILQGSVLTLVLSLGFSTYYYKGHYNQEVSNYIEVSSKNVELLAQLKNDSDAITKLAKDAEDRVKIAASAVRAASLVSKGYDSAAQGILIAKPTSSNLCISADYLFNSYLGQQK